jgi:hypothetical protein
MINHNSCNEITMNFIVFLKKWLLLLWILLIICITFYVIFKFKKNDEKLNEGIWNLKILIKSIFRFVSFWRGHFWVFTDAHVDVLYRPDGDPATRCRNVSSNNRGKIIRKFGHFDCDTPGELLSSTLTAAKKIDSNIDFIIWMGYPFYSFIIFRNYFIWFF